jgi:hypothetical protein
MEAGVVACCWLPAAVVINFMQVFHLMNVISWDYALEQWLN